MKIKLKTNVINDIMRLKIQVENLMKNKSSPRLLPRLLALIEFIENERYEVEVDLSIITEKNGYEKNKTLNTLKKRFEAFITLIQIISNEKLRTVEENLALLEEVKPIITFTQNLLDTDVKDLFEITNSVFLQAISGGILVFLSSNIRKDILNFLNNLMSLRGSIEEKIKNYQHTALDKIATNYHKNISMFFAEFLLDDMQKISGVSSFQAIDKIQNKIQAWLDLFKMQKLPFFMSSTLLASVFSYTQATVQNFSAYFSLLQGIKLRFVSDEENPLKLNTIDILYANDCFTLRKLEGNVEIKKIIDKVESKQLIQKLHAKKRVVEENTATFTFSRKDSLKLIPLMVSTIISFAAPNPSNTPIEDKNIEINEKLLHLNEWQNKLFFAITKTPLSFKTANNQKKENVESLALSKVSDEFFKKIQLALTNEIKEKSMLSDKTDLQKELDFFNELKIEINQEIKKLESPSGDLLSQSKKFLTELKERFLKHEMMISTPAHRKAFLDFFLSVQTAVFNIPSCIPEAFIL